MNWFDIGASLVGGLVAGIGGTLLAQKLTGKPAPAGRDAYEAIAKKRLEQLEREKR